MRLDIQKLLNNEEKELFTWVLSNDISQICCGPMFGKAEEAMLHAEHFVAAFNSDIKIEINQKSIDKYKSNPVRRGFQLILGGKT